MASVNVHFLPSLVTPEELQGRTVVVVDVLRATTTIASALAAGARCVVPCLEVEDAARWRQELGGDVVLGGERGGVRIPGFDLGNSPAEYTPDRVRGKVLVFTTTNGTRALQHAAQGSRVLLASFANFAAVCRELVKEREFDILCAGTNQRVTREDVLLAGALAARWTDERDHALLNDPAALAVDAWRSVSHQFANGGSLADLLRHSAGGRNLIELGLGHDIDLAASVDLVELVPELDPRTWRILPAAR